MFTRSGQEKFNTFKKSILSGLSKWSQKGLPVRSAVSERYLSQFVSHFEKKVPQGSEKQFFIDLLGMLSQEKSASDTFSLKHYPGVFFVKSTHTFETVGEYRNPVAGYLYAQLSSFLKKLEAADLNSSKPKFHAETAATLFNGLGREIEAKHNQNSGESLSKL